MIRIVFFENKESGIIQGQPIEKEVDLEFNGPLTLAHCRDLVDNQNPAFAFRSFLDGLDVHAVALRNRYPRDNTHRFDNGKTAQANGDR